MDEVAAESFNFLHLTLQEYMAALHLSEQPVEKQISLFRNYIPVRSDFGRHQGYDDRSSSHFRIVLRFLAGIRKFVGYSTSSIRSLLTHHNSSKLQISLDGLHCIYEAQNTRNVCEAIGMSAVSVRVHTPKNPGTVTPFDFFVLGYCVSHSNCPWEINFGACGIGDEEMEMLVRGALEDTCTAEHSGYISVMAMGNGNKITSAGLNQLLNIRELLKIRELTLTLNPLGRGGAVSLLKSPLVYNLEDLALTATEISVEDCHALSELLLSSPTLQCINIGTNDLPPEAVGLILTGLKHHPILERLDIAHSHFNLQNCISLASLPQPPRRLFLHSCHIDTKGAVELARVLDHNTVTHLYLHGNHIGIEGAAALAKELFQNTSLQELFVRQSEIGLEGTEKLIHSLIQNSTLTRLQLPGEYESSVETSEVYRRVKDRIDWGKWCVLFTYAPTVKSVIS